MVNVIDDTPYQESDRNFFVADSLLGTAAICLNKYLKTDKNVLIYAPNNFEINKIKNFLLSFIDEKNIISFETDELIRVEYISKSKEMIAQELFNLYELSEAKHKIIIMSPSSILRYYPNKEFFLSKRLYLKKGETYDYKNVIKILEQSGYLRVNKIDQSLQYAKRGDILDIFSINYDNPIRIEFFGDTIESIKYFEISTQRSIKEIDKIIILPGTYLLLEEDKIDEYKEIISSKFNKDRKNIKEYYLPELENEVNELLVEIESLYLSQKNYKYYSLLNKNTSSLLDYFDDYYLIISNEQDFKTSKDILITESKKFMNELFENGKALSDLEYFNLNNKEGNPLEIFVLNNFYTNKNALNIPLIKPSLEIKNTNENIVLIKNFLSLNYKVIVVTDDKYQVNKTKEIFKYLNIDFAVSDNLDLSKQALILTNKLYQGFENSKEKIVFLTSNELFGVKKNNYQMSSKFKEGIILGSYLELVPGDYVVHEYKGIGEFKEITTLLVDGKHEDYIKILYANDDILYVPLYQFDLIRKYVGKDGVKPRLNSLNGEKWKNTKKRIKEKIDDLTERLLNLYQERAQVKGFQFVKDDEIQEEFESKFEHELTKDQQISIDEIKKDMESIHPMDRLLCGDVGFGKTEIAFRAAFKAILSGKQVCFLCPTTVLAKQHYELSLTRFFGFGVKICLLSRLNTEAQNNENIKKINEGAIDLVIATHKVLGKKVTFKNLGLLIIDEEQRFGVEQKEKIKEINSNIDVLTLSATPIPRTLQSSLIGLKSVSTIKTAPKERMPIQTYVIGYDDNIIKDLIKKELSRDGQIYFVYNYVDSIYSMAQRINKMVPECKIGVIHGKLNKEDIEEVMNNFYLGEIDLLLCTSIIENGIDVKNANLLLVYDADHFGLSQLYQIKGRVGRGDRMAFAYLMIKQNKEITEEAKLRLKSIQDFTELGSGYKISQRDLLIRGAGDVLGSQQAGFIDEVGIDMYMKLLKESIEEKKSGIKKNERLPVFLNLNIDAYIPSSYASDESKIEIYQKILDCKTIEDISYLKSELRDIYGKIPDSTLVLLSKREIDIYFEDKSVFENLSDFDSSVTLDLTEDFSSINGIGSTLFTSLLNYINKIKIVYSQRKLKIIVYKRNDWISLLKTIMKTILNLDKINKKVVYEN